MHVSPEQLLGTVQVSAAGTEAVAVDGQPGGIVQVSPSQSFGIVQVSVAGTEAVAVDGQPAGIVQAAPLQLLGTVHVSVEGVVVGAMEVVLTWVELAVVGMGVVGTGTLVVVVPHSNLTL